ncbi:MAG: thiamine pyrophosphate-binding protein [bacterium]|nr:thiamine pyrophosphate-binding protein [Rhodocyclaceae bacterium]
MKVAEFLLQSLEAVGVRHIFGNPGTTEIPLVRACAGRGPDGISYVVALSEVSAVPMADAQARLRRGLGVVNLHVAPGLGNGMGNLYTAGIAKSPLLVLVGSQDSRFLHTGPILHGPLEQMVRPLVKAVYTLASPGDIAFHVRQAIRVALTPPTGPVALICAPDLLELEIDAQPVVVQPPRLAGLAAGDAAAFAAFLQGARSPALIAGEDVHWAGASGALRQLAESIGAPVYSGPYTAVLPLDTRSASHAGYLSPGFRAIGERLREHDALLFVGFRNFRTTLYAEPALRQAKAWLGHDPAVLAADGEFELARLADLDSSLLAIGTALVAASVAGEGATRRRWLPEVALPEAAAAVFHPTRAIVALLRAFGDAIVFDESGLSTSDVRQFIDARAGEYLINGSGGIGWALAAAVGGALVRPERQVLAVVGDGSSLYASEALWTAVHRGARLLLVVLSNRRYATLNEAAGRLADGPIDLFSLEPPVLDFSGLAKLHGLAFSRCDSEAELADFLLRSGGHVEASTLLELRFDPSIAPVMAARHF